MKKLKWIFSDWLIGIILTLLILGSFLIEWYPLQALEYKTYDLRMKLRQKEVSSPVVIIAIDDESIANMGRWPWPRAYMADMIHLISSYGARIIGINVLFTEEDLSSGLVEMRAVREAVEEFPGFERNKRLSMIYELIMEAEERLDNDAKLAWAIESAGNVILPLFFTLGDRIGEDSSEMEEFLKKNATASPGTAPYVSAVEVIPPIPDFSASVSALGHINLIPDRDGTIRNEPLFIQFQGSLFPSFALQMVLQYLGHTISDITASERIAIGQTTIPSDRQYKMFISYNGKYNTFPYYSFFDVINEKISPEVFKDKIVMIGHTGTGIAALKVTPLQHTFPTVEIEANVIENILSGNFLSRSSWAPHLEIVIIVLFGIFVSIIIPRLKAGLSAAISAVVLIIWNGAATYLFVDQGLWLKMFYPTLLLGLGYTLIISKRYLITEKKKEIVEADSIETNKMLGLSFQGQGMLDLAFEKFRRCPVEDETVKDLLYNLGLDFERKRMLNKAAAVYQHIFTAGKFKDIKERIEKLKTAGETMIFGAGAARKDSTVLMEGAETTPTLGRYEVERELGHGAMGTVYLGKDPKINRSVAIKTMRFDEVEEDQLTETKERFFREAEAAGTLSHPNIVTIYDAGEDYDLAYVAMELLDGNDLSEYCRKDDLLQVKEVLRIIGAIADALHYAHNSGVVHRDVKPANIMLLKNGDIKVTDFGIARVMASSKTQTGVVLGTPSYMSPEQVVGKKVDGRSDLFSLGVVFYELLTAEKPFKGDSIATIMYNIANKPPPLITKVRPDLPDCCAYIVHKLLLKEREKRYQKGSDVLKHVNICLKKVG